MDFTPIRSSNLDVFDTLDQNNRRACFIVFISLDQEIENSETFSLQLRSLYEFVPDSGRSIVTIEPNVVYVTIEDTTGMQNENILNLLDLVHLKLHWFQ